MTHGMCACMCVCVRACVCVCVRCMGRNRVGLECVPGVIECHRSHYSSTPVESMRGHHQIIIRSSSDRHQIVIRSSSDHHQIIIRSSSDHHQIIVRSSGLISYHPASLLHHSVLSVLETEYSFPNIVIMSLFDRGSKVELKGGFEPRFLLWFSREMFLVFFEG